MAHPHEVTHFLRPEGGWVQSGEDYKSIVFVDCDPFTEEEYLAAFSSYEDWKTQQQEEREAKKMELFERLGITEDEAKLLLG
jgi:hypothetical protein